MILLYIMRTYKLIQKKHFVSFDDHYSCVLEISDYWFFHSAFMFSHIGFSALGTEK